MLDIKFDSEDAILTFPKELVTSEYVQRFLERLRLEAALKQSKLSDSDAWELSEQMKESWWTQHRDELLARMGG